MLKAYLALALSLSLVSALRFEARSKEAQDFVVGSVRDSDGNAIADASVRATDARGELAGAGRTDGEGTFAIPVSRSLATLEIRCPHCQTRRVTATAGANLAIVVRRYGALVSDVPSAKDLAALPYGRVVDALALVPFALPSSDGSAISDRGLGGGHGLIVDDGAALADLATGSSALIDFPDRSVQRLEVTRAEDAYRYGPYAGSGVFALDTLGDGASAALDTGRQSALAVEPLSGTVRPAFSLSSDSGIVARRYEADLVTPFAGGQMRLGIADASERVDTGTLSLGRNLDSARFAYATASRQYRTFVDLATSRVTVAGNGTVARDYSSAYTDAGFRLERPGVVTVATGVRASQQSAVYDAYPALPDDLSGRATAVTTYVEAHADDGATRIDAGFGSTLVTATTAAVENEAAAATESALLPSLQVRRRIAGGLYARAGYSQSLRVPTLVEDAMDPARTFPQPLERAELLDSALGFDAGGRVRAEAIAYREFTRGGADRRLDGLGGSLVWQIAPLVSLRVWSLRTNPLDVVSRPYAATEPASRQVLWATYDGSSAFRIDALLHRDIGNDTRAAISLDADVWVPCGSHFAIDVATSRRDGVRRYGVGLRAR